MRDNQVVVIGWDEILSLKCSIEFTRQCGLDTADRW